MKNILAEIFIHVSRMRFKKKKIIIIIPVVGHCHQGMARPQFADEGNASNMKGICE